MSCSCSCSFLDTSCYQSWTLVTSRNPLFLVTPAKHVVTSMVWTCSFPAPAPWSDLCCHRVGGRYIIFHGWSAHPIHQYPTLRLMPHLDIRTYSSSWYKPRYFSFTLSMKVSSVLSCWKDTMWGQFTSSLKINHCCPAKGKLCPRIPGLVFWHSYTQD